MDDYEIVASIVGDNRLIATLSEYPYQGIQALIDKVYLWNPQEVNDLIVRLNELIEEIIINRDYNRLNNKPVLDTDNEESLEYAEDETIQGTIKLHRVAKTGSYNSLRDLPPLGELAAKDQIKDEDIADDAEIARSKLSPDVVASLDLADTAVQEIGTSINNGNITIVRSGNAVDITSSTHVFEIADAATVWHIVHNMQKWPSVTVVDSAGTVVDCEIAYLDYNTCEARMNAAFKGTAYLN